MMATLSVSAQKEFVYGVYHVDTKKAAGGSYIVDLKNKKFLPDCDGGQYSDCDDMKNVKQVGEYTTFDWYTKDGKSLIGRGRVGKTKDGRLTLSLIYGKGTKFTDPIALGTQREQQAFEENGFVGLQKASVVSKGIDKVKGLFKKKDKDDSKTDNKAKSNKKK